MKKYLYYGRPCIICGKLVHAERPGRLKFRKYCSMKCLNGQGSRHPAWKGGKKRDGFGYILIWNPKHPFCENGCYVREHRLVMEKHIGRFLKPNEKIHHLNGIKNDNRIENLIIMSLSEHNKLHYHDIERSRSPQTGRFISI